MNGFRVKQTLDNRIWRKLKSFKTTRTLSITTLSITTPSITIETRSGLVLGLGLRLGFKEFELCCRPERLYFYYRGQKKELHFNEWKGINRKQNTRWQHLSRLKASALFSLQIFLIVMKQSSLYLGLVLPSGG